MNTQLNTHKTSQTALINVELSPTKQVDVATILWCFPHRRNKPLVIKNKDGKLFKCDGLTDSQFQQLPLLMADLVGAKLLFSYYYTDHGTPIDAQFMSLLPQNDIRPSVLGLISKFENTEGAKL